MSDAARRRSRLVGVLVAWFGIFQAGHVLLSGRYLVQRGEPPFPRSTGRLDR